MQPHAHRCTPVGQRPELGCCRGRPSTKLSAFPPTASTAGIDCAVSPRQRRRRWNCGARRRSLSCTEAQATPAQPAGTQRKECILYDLHAQEVPYTRAWAWQKALVRRKLAALAAGEEPADELLVLQHTPVYTLGTGSTVDNLRFSADAPPFGAELHRTERGGEVTYHGPGQLVLYPILNLRNHQTDLHWYMRSLEDVTIKALASLGLQGERIPGLTGTWCAGHKVAAQGVRATRWVSYHGVALNVDPDLAHFSAIVPCGIADRPVGSVATLLAAQGPGACCLAPQSAHHAEEPAVSTPRAKNAALMYTARGAMLHAFQQVFCVDLVPQDGMTILAPSNRAHAVEALLDDIVLTHSDNAM